MKFTYTVFIGVFILCIQEIKAITYYSAQDGHWGNPSTWSLTDGGLGGAGVPNNTDEVIIRSGDDITIHRDFPNHFLREGNFTIRAGGSFTLNGDAYFDFRTPGTEFHIYGTFQATDDNSRLRNRAYMHLHPGSVVEIGNDFDIFNTSITIVDTDMIVGDDLRVIGNLGQVCGNGTIILGLDADARVTNVLGGTGLDQVCSTVCVINDGLPGITNCGLGAFTLPITLLTFEVQGKVLYWEVIESEVKAFEVYFSSNLKEWTRLAVLDSQGDGQNHYRFPLSNRGYYQIHSVEDEPFISNPIYFIGGENPKVKLYPNPVSQNQSIQIIGGDVQHVDVYDASGRFIKNIKPKDTRIPIDLNPGKYIFRLYNAQSIQNQWIIVK